MNFDTEYAGKTFIPVNQIKMKRFRFIIVVFFLFPAPFINDTAAQDYLTGLGLRGGLSNGITVKHFINERDAVEGILTTRWQGFKITGMLERHMVAFDTDGLFFFYGAGAHIGFWSGYDDHPWFDNTDTHSVLGIDGVIGLEYVFAEIPVSLGLDWKPEFNLIGYTGFAADEFALSVRYLFR